jgi:hypothetical protein
MGTYAHELSHNLGIGDNQQSVRHPATAGLHRSVGHAEPRLLQRAGRSAPALAHPLDGRRLARLEPEPPQPDGARDHRGGPRPPARPERAGRVRSRRREGHCPRRRPGARRAVRAEHPAPPVAGPRGPGARRPVARVQHQHGSVLPGPDVELVGRHPDEQPLQQLHRGGRRPARSGLVHAWARRPLLEDEEPGQPPVRLHHGRASRGHEQGRLPPA